MSSLHCDLVRRLVCFSALCVAAELGLEKLSAVSATQVCCDTSSGLTQAQIEEAIQRGTEDRTASADHSLWVSGRVR